MGLKDKLKKCNEEHKDDGFHPLELNEGNVQAIFNRCLATKASAEKTSSILFYREFGYEKDDIGIVFDKNALHANRKNIEYLYGQLAAIHGFETIIKMEDFAKSYLGHKWTEEKGLSCDCCIWVRHSLIKS